MSRTLNLSDHLFDLGQTYLNLGRDNDAQCAFQRLIRFPDLKDEMVEEAQAGLAEIHIRRNDPVQARRHLHVALARKPGCARYHHLLGQTLEEDEVERALYHFEQAVRLEPDNAEFQADLGLCLLSIGEQERGLEHLQRTTELEPDEPAYVRQRMQKLLEADRDAEARQLVMTALFAHSRDQRFRALWIEYQFRVVQRAQHRAMMQKRQGNDGPVVLPFEPSRLDVPRLAESEDGGTVRIDRPQPIRRPHLRQPAQKRQRR